MVRCQFCNGEVVGSTPSHLSFVQLMSVGKLFTHHHRAFLLPTKRKSSACYTAMSLL